MSAPERVWVEHRCHKCGKTWQAAMDDVVYCPCNNIRKPLTRMTVGTIQTQARRAINK